MGPAGCLNRQLMEPLDQVYSMGYGAGAWSRPSIVLDKKMSARKRISNEVLSLIGCIVQRREKRKEKEDER